MILKEYMCVVFQKENLFFFFQMKIKKKYKLLEKWKALK